MSTFGFLDNVDVPSGGRKKKRRRKRVPTVGRRGAGVVNLSRPVRRRLHRQARRTARRRFRPEIQAAKAEVRSVRQAKRREVRSVAGAGREVGSAIDAALAGLKKTGLKGQYLQQTAQEFAARRADVPADIALLKADVRQEYAPEITAAQEGVATARVDRAQKAADEFASLLEKAKTQARSAVKERQSKREESRESRSDRGEKRREHSLELKTALHEGARWLAAYPDYTPDTEAKWKVFEEVVANAEGVPDLVARDAVRILRRRLRRRFKGVVGTTGTGRIE